MDISIDPIDIMVGLGLGYYYYKSNTIDEKKGSSSEDIRNSAFDPVVFANKKQILMERKVPIPHSDDPSRTEALMDDALKMSAYKELRKPDLRSMESGLARTAGQKLLWRQNWDHSRSMLNFPEPEDAQ